MTVADWYRLYVIDGRATVVYGSLDEPHSWVTQPRRDQDVYAVCWSRREKLELVSGTCSMTAVKLL